MATRNIQLRFTESIDMKRRSLPNRSAWLRRIITEAAQRELMKGDEAY
jgi:hypothetical protein